MGRKFRIAKRELRNVNENLRRGFSILKFEIRNPKSEMLFPMLYAYYLDAPLPTG